MKITEFILYTYVISYLIRYFCPDLGQEWEKLHLVCIFSGMHIPKRTQIFTYMHMFLRSMISKNMRMFINMRMFLTICRWSIIILINCFSQIIKFVPRFSDSVAILHFQLQKFLPFNPHLRADTGMPVQWSVAVPQHCFQSIRLTTIQICMSLSHF
ncbi:Hypothetical_protein [Hexamita inflata]|uniref:Hypothetical_protein n=1 Tax=Hexamita inflata TaxID=28002 RepID=A0AA86NMX5_9EUKA|nr:Hypothetical protein HINF_LOCUS9578 [Hexamita inflata]